ncbi:MAG: methylated-DNA-[protein]-cysteine S-methyltransferase [Myxococcota bacterium]|jgi:methylated-DNA-[protein]-cysteine S-methyltransferase
MRGPVNYARLDTAIGPLLIVGDDAGLRQLTFDGHPDAEWHEDPTALATALTQLREWFAGEREVLDLPSAAAGTPFQTLVWAQLSTIPYGTTTTYAALARALGKPGAARAVGLANGANPLAVLCPCHRVLGANGSLTGYAGGLHRKQWLLTHESRQPGLPF